MTAPERAGLPAPAEKVRHCVMLPFYNRLSMVARCVAKLLEQALPSTRIVLVDDGSTQAAHLDPEIRRLAADPRVTLLRHAENRGVAAARNTALGWCHRNRIDLVLMIDSDCEPSPDFVREHLRLHAAHPEVACIGAQVEGIGHGFWAWVDRVTTWVHLTGAEGEVRHPYHLGATNMSVKLARLRGRAGVFEERLATGEDALFIRELRRNGERVFFSHSPRIVHHDRETFRGVLWHHYQYGQHQYFVQLGDHLAPRCFDPLYRLAFTLLFAPLVPIFALAGSALNLAPWLRTRPSYVACYPFLYLLWLAKGIAVLQSAVMPSWTLRTPRPAVVVEPWLDEPARPEG